MKIYIFTVILILATATTTFVVVKNTEQPVQEQVVVVSPSPTPTAMPISEQTTIKPAKKSSSPVPTYDFNNLRIDKDLQYAKINSENVVKTIQELIANLEKSEQGIKNNNQKNYEEFGVLSPEIYRLCQDFEKDSQQYIDSWASMRTQLQQDLKLLYASTNANSYMTQLNITAEHYKTNLQKFSSEYNAYTEELRILFRNIKEIIPN